VAPVSSVASGVLSGAAHEALAGAAVSVAGAAAVFANGARLSIDEPLSAETTFTATGLSWGQTLTALAVCTVTDTVSGRTTQATCLVEVSCVMPSQILTEGSGLPLLIEGGLLPLVVEP
jgi:hypothetical protein